VKYNHSITHLARQKTLYFSKNQTIKDELTLKFSTLYGRIGQLPNKKINNDKDDKKIQTKGFL